jgi:hypothetical protein
MLHVLPQLHTPQHSLINMRSICWRCWWEGGVLLTGIHTPCCNGLQVGVTKAALLVLSQLLAAVDPTPSAWPAAMPAMGLLLGFVTDTRAKVGLMRDQWRGGLLGR